MTHLAPQPATAGRAAPIPQSDTEHFIDGLFAGQAGWVRLGYIDGDPSIPKGTPGYAPMRSEWYEWPRQRATLLAQIAHHDAQGHNTYVRQVLFQYIEETIKGTPQSTLKADIAHALPSRWIWRDDVKDLRTASTALVETSEGNYQALIQLDRLASTQERKRLMTAWRNANADSDDCSADPVHFIRIPGGHNSKRHGWYAVRYAVRSERVYPTDALLAKCAEGDTHALSSSVSKNRAQLHQAGAWKNLQNGQALLNSPRWQAVINARPQLRILLVENNRVIITNKNGKQDDSLSAQRAVFVQNTITAWSDKRPGHLPENEIRAVAKALQPKLGPDKSDYQYQTDIDAMIAEYRPRNYQPKATIYLNRAARSGKRTPTNASAPLPRGKGRPAGNQSIEADRFLRYLQETIAGANLVKIGTLAGDFGISRQTAHIYLDILSKAGHLETETKRGRNGGIVIRFTPQAGAENVNVNQPSESPVSLVAERANPQFAGAPIGETSKDQVECVSPIPPAADNLPPTPATEQVPALSLADLVTEAIEGYGTRYTPHAGAVKPLERVIAHVRTAGGKWSDAAIEKEYRWQLQTRKWARQDEREREKARKMQPAALKRKSRSLASQAAAMMRAVRDGVEMPDRIEFDVPYRKDNGEIGYQKRTTKAPTHPTERNARRLLHLAGIYAEIEAELDAREARRFEQQGYTLAEQREMLEIAEQDAAKRQRTTARARKAASVEPAVIEIPGGWRGLVDRLKARKETLAA